MPVSRRQFIRVGFAGAALLAATRLLDRPAGAANASYRILDEQSAATVTALVPVVLAGALPGDPAARAKAIGEVVETFDRAVGGLALAVQDEIAQLFSFLHFAPTRAAFAGLWSPVSESSAEELAAFLQRWRTSHFDLQRVSYLALTQLIFASWYDNPAAWAVMGYPGPPEVS
jgi:hypothetical protein